MLRKLLLSTLIILAATNLFADERELAYLFPLDGHFEKADPAVFCTSVGVCVVATFDLTEQNQVEMKLYGTKVAADELGRYEFDVNQVSGEQFKSMFKSIDKRRRFSFELDDDYDKATTDTSLGMRAPSRENDRYRAEVRAAVDRHAGGMCRVGIAAAAGAIGQRLGGGAAGAVAGKIGDRIADSICGRRNCP